MSSEITFENAEENLQELHRRIHTGSYHPQPSRRIWIPKADGRQRPIGVAALEDKIVQQALDALYMALTSRKVSWVLDADIQGVLRSSGSRVADPVCQPSGQ